MAEADQFVTAFAAALLLAHAGVIAWALRRNAIAPLLVLNVLVSAGVVAYWAGRLSDLFDYVAPVQLFVGLEAAVLATSLLAFRFRVPRPLIWSIFVLHALLAAAVLALMFTFRLPRMI